MPMEAIEEMFMSRVYPQKKKRKRCLHVMSTVPSLNENNELQL